MKSYETVPKSYTQHLECTHGFKYAIRSIQFKYEYYSAQYGYSQSYTASYDLTQPLCVYKTRVRSYVLGHNKNN